MTTNELATQTDAPVVATKSSTELTIAADQTGFTEQQIAGLKQLGVQDATPGDLQVFFHQAKRAGLDPFAKQIYMIGRKTKTGGYRGEPERWETKWTIQVGIDGYRLGARRIAKAEGGTLGKDGPYWHDGNGWSDVWLQQNRPPAAAKFTVIRDGESFTAVANFAEYVQTKGNGDPNAMWAKMPAKMLAKCAEAAAYRQAFPEQFSGVIYEDAAHTVIDAEVVEAQTKKAAQRGVAGLAAAIGAAPAAAVDPRPAAAPEPEPTPEETPAKPSVLQNRKLNALFERAGLTKEDKSGRQIVAAALHPAPATADGTQHIIDQLEGAAAQGDDALVDTVQAIITERDEANQ